MYGIHLEGLARPARFRLHLSSPPPRAAPHPTLSNTHTHTHTDIGLPLLPPSPSPPLSRPQVWSREELLRGGWACAEPGLQRLALVHTYPANEAAVQAVRGRRDRRGIHASNTGAGHRRCWWSGQGRSRLRWKSAVSRHGTIAVLYSVRPRGPGVGLMIVPCGAAHVPCCPRPTRRYDRWIS
jgi:hypothetical protein